MTQNENVCRSAQEFEGCTEILVSVDSSLLSSTSTDQLAGDPPRNGDHPKTNTSSVFLTTPTALPTVLLRVGPTSVVMCVFYLRVNLRFLRVGGRVIVNMRFNNV